ncbi:MAG: class I SAM-dependent methyltransferase [Spirochaetales bacterium]|jgi:SAM-dependent methyltransferase|nr:class I SAM-dependent methyltransferase [Spirochaetales bacterium]
MNFSRKKLEGYYNPRLSQYTESYQILDWESPEAQRLRFKALAGGVPLSGLSLLDVGCGCGDLFGFLKEEGIETDYTGVDILPGMVDKARALYPGGRFYCADVFADSSPSSDSPKAPPASGEFHPASIYDVVYTSGIFNLNLGNNEEFFLRAIPVLGRLAKQYLVVSLLDTASPDRRNRYYYFSPGAAAKTLRRQGFEIEVVKEYLGNDFTLVGRRPGREPEPGSLLSHRRE